MVSLKIFFTNKRFSGKTNRTLITGQIFWFS